MDEEDEEEEGNSSGGCWEESHHPNGEKDCIHLDNPNQPTSSDLLEKHIHEMQLHQHESNNYNKCHPIIISNPNSADSCNNLAYNFHQVQRQQPHTHSSGMSYFQNDVIMSLSWTTSVSKASLIFPNILQSM